MLGAQHGEGMTKEEWMRLALERDREQIGTMKKSLEMFEAGDLHLFHNHVDVSEDHMAFLRRAIAELESVVAKYGAEIA